MTTSEKIKDKQDKIQKCKEKIATEQEKIKKFTKEIEELENLEVRGLLKEYNMPLSDLKLLIKDLSKRATETNIEQGSDKNETSYS